MKGCVQWPQGLPQPSWFSEKEGRVRAARGTPQWACPNDTLCAVTHVGEPSLRSRVPRTVQGTRVTGPTARSHPYVPSPPQARWLPCCPARALLSGRGPGWHQRHLRATPGTVVQAGQGQGRCAGLFCVSAQGPDQTSPRLLPSLPADEQQPGAPSGMRGGPRENAECEMCHAPALALPVP